MPERRPLVLVSGAIRELPSGDTLPGGGSGAPAGNSGQVQFNQAGALAGAANVEIGGGDLQVVYDPATPVTPPAGRVKLFAKQFASRVMFAAVGPSGFDYAMQPAIWRQKLARWNAPGNSTTVPGVDGMNAPTAVGTASSRSVATTTPFTRARRLGYVTGATAGALCGHYLTAAQWTTGNGSDLGGFFYSCRFGVSDSAASVLSGARMFVGMSSSIAAPTNVEPTSITNCVGLAQISTDGTQLYIVYGGSAAQTATPLGVNFPPVTGAGSQAGVLYELTLFAPPGQAGVVHYYVERIGTSFVATGTLSPVSQGVQTPAASTLLAPRAWRSNNAQALVAGIDISSLYIETDW